MTLEGALRELPWRSGGQDSLLPLQGARVQSLVGEDLRSPRGAAKKKKKVLCAGIEVAGPGKILLQLLPSSPTGGILSLRLLLK